MKLRIISYEDAVALLSCGVREVAATSRSDYLIALNRYLRHEEYMTLDGMEAWPIDCQKWKYGVLVEE